MHDGCDCTVPGTCLVFVVAVQWVLAQSGRGRFLDGLGQTVSSGAGSRPHLVTHAAYLFISNRWPTSSIDLLNYTQIWYNRRPKFSGDGHEYSPITWAQI
jgi:hypothetical protein